MEKLRYGMVGGGPESFIGDAHRKAINIDAMAVLTAGAARAMNQFNARSAARSEEIKKPEA